MDKVIVPPPSHSTSILLLAVITVPVLHHLHECVLIQQVQSDVTVMS
jgi:hypothetical protein